MPVKICKDRTKNPFLARLGRQSDGTLEAPLAVDLEAGHHQRTEEMRGMAEDS